MKTNLSLLTCLIATACILTADQTKAENAQETLTLAEKGTTAYTVLLPSKADDVTRSAASELTLYLKQSTHAEFPVREDPARSDRREIRLEQTDTDPAVPKHPQGYRIFVDGDDLVIRSRSPHGLLYGVYGLLENKLGCRWYAPDETLVPHHETLILTPFETTEFPTFSYRNIYAADIFQNRQWEQRLRLNGGPFRWADKPANHLHNFVPGYSNHSFARLVPPDKHFATHPEYYGLINGKRDPNLLCLSNPVVFETALATLRTDLDSYKVRPCILSIAQNDCNGWCQCPECTRIIAEEKGCTGLLMRFLNKFDNALQGENVTILTLAYGDTNAPPAKTKPNPNIIIQFCPIAICYGHPPEQCTLSGNEGNTAIEKKLKGWAAIHQNLWVWSYHVNFAHSLQPFPNIHTLAPYFRYFAANGAKGIFAQSDGSQRGIALNSLRHYMIAKLLWNPQTDGQVLIREFLTHYYKEAAASMGEYLTALTATIENTPDRHTGIFDSPDTSYLSNDFIEKSEAIFTRALETVRNNPVALSRIQAEHLSIQYMILERWLAGSMQKTPGEIRRMVDEFETVCQQHGITGIAEHDGKGEQKRQFLNRIKEKLSASISR